jgi:mRNA interferase MazF
LVTGRFVPDVGDIVWLSFDPQAGHEQAGHRPALVLTPARYNGRAGLMIACPMTSRIKGYPFEVIVSRKPPSVVLADQARNMDWEARGATFKGRASDECMAEVRAKLAGILGLAT